MNITYFLLQTAIDGARRGTKEICVAWLDLENAFGSVPHDYIFEMMTSLELPLSLVLIINEVYTGATTRVRTTGGLSEEIPIASGVKQGCPLSPIVFNLAMEPMSRAINARRNKTAYKLKGGLLLQLLVYADDLAKNPKSTQELLDKQCG